MYSDCEEAEKKIYFKTDAFDKKELNFVLNPLQVPLEMQFTVGHISHKTNISRFYNV